MQVLRWGDGLRQCYSSDFDKLLCRFRCEMKTSYGNVMAKESADVFLWQTNARNGRKCHKSNGLAVASGFHRNCGKKRHVEYALDKPDTGDCRNRRGSASHEHTAIRPSAPQRKCDGQEYIFRKIKDTMLINQTGVTIQDTYSIATPERAYLDMLYVYRRDYYLDNPGGLNWQKIMAIAPIYENKKMIQIVENQYKAIKEEYMHGT